MQTAWIYGKLNKNEILQEYIGKDTATAVTNVNNNTNQISVDVKKVPHKLSLKEAESLFVNFDGSQDVIFDLTNYAKTDIVPNYAEIDTAGYDFNRLKFFRKIGETKTLLFDVELSGFTQVQSDWNQSDVTKESYIKNKPTINNNALIGNQTVSDFNNNVTNKSNRFASENYVDVYGGKIDKIYTADGELTISNKQVTIPTTTENVLGLSRIWKDSSGCWNISTTKKN